uniref:SMP-LTD domain-containing protein n=1 Tax=Paramoeba aestuarina TaxID=180227 RepID=A0A7S4KNI2_9EUKA
MALSIGDMRAAVKALVEEDDGFALSKGELVTLRIKSNFCVFFHPKNGSETYIPLESYQVMVRTPDMVYQPTQTTLSKIKWKFPTTVVLQPRQQQQQDETKQALYLTFISEREAERWTVRMLRSLMPLIPTPAIIKENLITGENNTVLSESKIIQILVARVFWISHDSAPFRAKIKKKIEAKIRKVDLPSVIQECSVEEAYFGPNIPQFRNITIHDAHLDGVLNMSCDMLYPGGFSVLLKLTVSFEKQVSFLQLPTVTVHVRITIKKMEGRMRIEISEMPGTNAWVCFLEEPDIHLDLETEFGTQETGAHNVPQIADIAVSQLRKKILKTMVYPAMESLELPALGKKKKSPPKEEQKGK